MKQLILTLLPLFIFFGSYAQSTEETEIRKLENEMREAFLKRDSVILFKLLSPNLVINSPWNKVLTMEDITNNLRKGGGTDTLTFDGNIEKITFTNNIAIVLGQETRVATGKAINVGKTIQRRFTDVWMNNKKKWQLVGRQSTVFVVE